MKLRAGRRLGEFVQREEAAEEEATGEAAEKLDALREAGRDQQDELRGSPAEAGKGSRA